MENSMPDTTNKSVTALCLINGMERLCYYGFRAIIVLFLIQHIDDGGLNLSQADALTYYGVFTGLVYLSSFCGGILSDLLLGAYRSTLLGLALMIGGFFFLNFVDVSNYYLACGLIALGSGLVKPSLPTMIAHQLQQQPQMLDSVFTGQFLMINLGAFLSGILIGAISSSTDYRTGFVACGLLGLVTLACLIWAKAKYIKVAPWNNLQISGNNSVLSGLTVLSICSVLSIVFWLTFELGGTVLYRDFAGDMGKYNIYINVVTIVIAGAFSLFLWLKVQINTWLKLVLSFIIYAAGWYLFASIDNESLNIGQTLAIVAILHSLAEILFSPMLYSLIARHGYMPLMATHFGLFAFAIATANWLTGKLYNSTFELASFGHLFLGLAGVTLLLWLIYSKIDKQNASVTD